MSSFSRGFVLRHCCNLPSRIHAAPSRCFSLSQLQHAAKAAARKVQLPKNLPKTPGTPASKRIPKAPVPTLVAPAATYQSYASKLAAKGQATLLYKAPSQTLFLITSYTGASFCFAYAIYNFQTNSLSPPPGLPTWVPIAFGGVCFLMAVFGGWLALGPARLIRTITARPSPTNPGSLLIDVELRKMLPVPFFPARVITAAPEEMALNHRLWTPPPPDLSAYDRILLRKEEESRRAEELRWERERILTAPFRHASRAFYNLFRAAARTWSRTGFLKLEVKGQVYKLDISGGWALDDGRALDRLLKVKPKL